MHPFRHIDPDQFSVWLSQLELECRRLLSHSGRPLADHDDIVSIVVSHAWEKGTCLMDAYPSATLYARVRVPHAAESFYRTNRAQRGEGARLRRSADGDVAAGRTVVSIDATPSLGSTAVAIDGPEDQVVDAIGVADTIEDVLRALVGVVPDEDIVAYVLVHAHGWTVVDVAGRAGIARETACRRIGRVRRAIERYITGFTPPV
ncbi:MAG: hypothetical protein ACO225_02395 [Ilumatobacteraceae bacterium]